MKRLFRLSTLVLGWLALAWMVLPAAAQVTTLEYRQNDTPNNFQSLRGVPITSTVNTNIGSDGRMTNFNSSGSVLLPTTNQFRGFISYGAVPGQLLAGWLVSSNSALLMGSNAFNGTVAFAMGLPIGTSNNLPGGAVAIVLRRGQIGAPYLSRQVSFSFGSVVEVPSSDENGVLLTNIANTAYWLPQPYTTNGHTNAAYGWSPHSRKVYAIQSGPLQVTWVKAAYATSKPADYTNVLTGATNYYSDAGNYFRLFTAGYVVSGSPVKPTRKMFWTERGFRGLGKPIAVPAARIGAVSIAYNNNFPRTVPFQYAGPGDTSPTDGNTNQVLQELRTLWYDQQQGAILAYNREGRVFVELLGDPRADGLTRESLGFEIVDVIKNPSPLDVSSDLGDPVEPPAPGTRQELTPEPVQQTDGQTFAYQQFLAGSGRLNLYATKETANLNDYLVHWMEVGEVGLKWPALLGRYQFVWPANVAKYSHYVRPLVATEDEAKATAVPLPASNAPAIAYQDPLDIVRGKLTETFRYYSFLSAAQPAHRALLRFSTGEDVAFERVFSWLDVNLKTTNFVGTVAENLSSVADYLNYQNSVATNTLYQAARSRGVNGNWKLHVRDDLGGGAGSIGSWAIQVETTNTITGLLTTNEFAGGAITIADNANASPYPSTVSVSGITGPVTRIRVKLNGIAHQYAADIDALLVGPNGQVCALMSDTGGDLTVSGLNLVFDDAAPSSLPYGSGISAGTYRPTDYEQGEAIPPGAVGPIGTSLDALLQPVPVPPTPVTSPWPSDLVAPRVVVAPVDVGMRINAPAGEPGFASAYLAGHLNQDAGTLFNVQAYLDPFTAGFAAADLGAIIPINAIPGTNTLEVWWFRTNAPTAGANAADASKGFLPIYWPSVLGRYTAQWPTSPREIVLASKKGSGTLEGFEALGKIYFQNNPALPGYNPNEEHAIMAGGTAYATRDDLNLPTSSQPHVLVHFTAGDGRPANSVFKVLREKPSAGLVFDYIVPAGQLLQPPMPLPLLAKPVDGSGDGATNYNTEPFGGNGDLPGAWNAANGPSGIYSNYGTFTYRDRHQDFWVYRGIHAGLPVLAAGSFVATNRTFTALSNATAVVGQPFAFSVHASRESDYLGLTVSNAPAWLFVSTSTNSPLTLAGTPATNDLGSRVVQVVVEDLYDHRRVTNSLTLTVVANGGTALAQGPLILPSTNSYTGTIVSFSNRPPSLAFSPNPSNSFTMRYYYKTEASFAWPGVVNPPAAGSIVPYLRAGTAGAYVGNGRAKTDPALDIVYRPVWPERDPKDGTKPLPVIDYGLTLANPQLGLPGVRDWKTARVLYQQSIAANLTNARASVVLHDPTREKVSAIASFGLGELPASVRSESYQGKVYFPNLPPHLAKRLFFDPARGTKGSLVLVGQFKDEIVGEDYILLNVLRGSDLASAFALCPQADAVNFPKWTNAIAALSTGMETFYENPAVPGTYVPNTNATVYVGVQDLAEVANDNVAVDSYALSATGPGSGYVTLVEAGGTANTQPGDPVAVHIFKVGGDRLHPGELKVIPAENPLSELVSFQHTPDLAGRFSEYEYEWRIAAPVDGLPPAGNDPLVSYQSLTAGTNQPRYTLGGAGIQVLGDNYIVLRYKSANTNHPLYNQWSEWTKPQLAEGWIKRVLAGINPFNQRTSDLFNNAANTDASILTSAGHRWEGDIALNLDTVNNYGLIEIYETVLRRGRSISIESGYNYGPANDALLLAAGYLSDLYMMTGNEAWADAANPTIGIGTANNTYGDIATALFAFKGQVPSLLEEELALVRGRDDFLQPGVTLPPFYNRLVWNYTRGIDAGEVIYALNYNIQENPSATPDGVINAADAARMFPQGHGDAYGHYLTALKGYYSLLLNPNFDWVPRIEAVLVLGVPVSVDYQDERKFATSAAAIGRAGRQAFDLTWRKDYQPGHDKGWGYFSPTRVNTQRSYVSSGSTNNPVRYWGMDHWASRVGQGDYLNWVVGNAIIPAVDPVPTHEGIQKVDRTTVPELTELATMAADLQTALDNAEGGLTPLGLQQGSIALDINPNVVVGPDNGTHFDQIYGRAKSTLNNAVAAFDDAKDVTRLMRSEQDSLAGVQAAVAQQELAFKNTLIELYGTPYTDDIGPGKTYKQGYDGPDLVHYSYVEIPEAAFGQGLSASNGPTTVKIDIQQLPASWTPEFLSTTFDFYVPPTSAGYTNGTHYLEFTFDPRNVNQRPATWKGRRVSPGQIQQAISQVVAARNAVQAAMGGAQGDADAFARQVSLFKSYVESSDAVNKLKKDMLTANQVLQSAEFANALFERIQQGIDKTADAASQSIKDAFPQVLIAGLAAGGDMTSAARAAIEASKAVRIGISEALLATKDSLLKALEFSTTTANQWIEFKKIGDLEGDQELKTRVAELTKGLGDVSAHYGAITAGLRAYDDAQRNLDALVAKGDRIQMEREVARQRTAALVQGFRTRDAGFRIFRNEKLERYKTLFDLAARYAMLAANAYDYETGLLDTDAGRGFVGRIIAARALGVVRNGEPQFAGSNTGDPGLSGALAEMKADWDVVKTRLGFNNPDAYGTTVSLRTENFRILPNTNGDTAWKDLLQQSRSRDITLDSDVRRHCLQISRGDGLPVPGIVLEFSTTIANGLNLFGQDLASGDHSFNPASFATKIFGVGAAMEGYRGMDAPSANSGAGGNSPSDPDGSFLDPLGLSATPYVYLIPVGVDSMRSPPLGDASAIREFNVDDVAIPLPFNIGASSFASGGLYLSADTLTEPLFASRKHQSFRPVPSSSYFSTSLYGSGGTLQRSQYTNNRLIGRSAWNSRWKLVIPGHTLLKDPDEGLERLIKTLRDVKLHFVTYSYSGN